MNKSNRTSAPLEAILDSIGPDASLGKDAWNDIEALSASGLPGIASVIGRYVVPKYADYDERSKARLKECLDYFLGEGRDELGSFPLADYPYLDRIDPVRFFQALREEIDQSDKNG